MAVMGFSDQYCLVDEKWIGTKEIVPTENIISVYEIFKVISGTALFFEDHIERLSNSLKLSNIHDFDIKIETLREHIKILCLKNNKQFGNIELSVSKSANKPSFLSLGFITHQYPTPIAYIQGVKTSLFDAVRENPNAKIKNTQTRKLTSKFLSETDFFEVLLVNDNGYITEGSKSNAFFIKDLQIYSAPSELVLPGISRKYVLKAIAKLNYKVRFELVKSDGINEFDAAFLCGTSLGVIPIQSIGIQKFNTQNIVLREIIQEFNAIISKYLQEYQNKA